MIVKFVKYLVRKKEGLFHVPRQYITPYDMRDANEEQIRLMQAGVARTPMEAQRILDYYETKRAVVALALMPKQDKPWWYKAWRRFVWFTMKLEGARFKIADNRKPDGRLPVEYGYDFFDEKNP